METIQHLINKYTEQERLLTLKEQGTLTLKEKKELNELKEDILCYECQYSEILKADLDTVELNLEDNLEK